MSLKCILINPLELTHPPTGLLYIGSVLESKGHQVQVKEVPVDMLVPFSVSLERMVEYLRNTKPDLIGITCMTSQAERVSTILRVIKDNNINAKVVVGGVHPSLVPDEVMGWGADYVVLYEGEETIAELAEVLKGEKKNCEVKGIYYRDNGKICHTQVRPSIENLDSIPFPAYHLVDSARFTMRKGTIRGLWLSNAWVWTSRGCPSLCTYCSAHRMFGKKVRYRSMDNIFKELQYMIKTFKNNALYIMDDTFTTSKRHVLDFCNRIQREFPGIVWGCQARVNLFDEEIASAFKNGGCLQVDFGIESGSQRVLDHLKKGVKVEQIVKAFENCKKARLRTFATVMVGNPDEDTNDIEATRRLLRRINPDFVVAYFTTPYPGTELFVEATSRGILPGDYNKTWHLLDGPLPWTKASKEDIRKAQKELTKFHVLKHYLFNPVFHYDMAKFAFKNPKIFLKILASILKGDIQKTFYIIVTINYLKSPSGARNGT